MNEFDCPHTFIHFATTFWCGIICYIGGYKAGNRDKQRLVDTAFENGVRTGKAEEQTKQKSMAKFISESPWL